MGATSVTGVSGDNKGMGSSEGQGKGTERMSLGVKKLIGPHVVLAGSVALVGGAASIEFATLPGVAGDYVGFAMSRTSGGVANVTALTTSVMTLAGTGTQTVNYMIVKVGV